MRQVVAAEYLSLDGVGEDPGRIGAFEHRGWIVPFYDDELAKYMFDQLAASDALLLGRTTYEGFVTVWPGRSGDPIADRMNSLPKLVASTTLKEPLEWNATLVEGDVAEEVRKLREQPGRNILIYGSGALVHTLLQLDLIDELQIMLVPVALGSGERFFRDTREPTTLSLTDVRTTGTGVVMLTYQRPPTDAHRSATPDVISGDWWLRRRQIESEPA
jgi:dihydrofolate reductase